jgi:hypothetical protein
MYIYRMKNLILFIIPGGIIFSLSSCSTVTPKYLHAPAPANLIQIEKKNDIKVSINYSATAHSRPPAVGSKQQSNGLNIQTALGVSNKFAIKLDAFNHWEVDRNKIDTGAFYDFKINYKRQGIELSTGFYKYYGKNKDVAFNIYSGIGIGNNRFNGFYRNDSGINRTYNADYFKWFIFPSLSVDISKHYSFVLGYKLSIVKFKNINTNDIDLKSGFYKDIPNKNSIFSDFVFDNQFSFNNMNGVKFHVMIGLIALHTRFSDYRVYSGGSSYTTGQYLYNDRFASIGIIADMNKLFAKQ